MTALRTSGLGPILSLWLLAMGARPAPVRAQDPAPPSPGTGTSAEAAPRAESRPAAETAAGSKTAAGAAAGSETAAGAALGSETAAGAAAGSETAAETAAGSKPVPAPASGAPAPAPLPPLAATASIAAASRSDANAPAAPMGYALERVEVVSRTRASVVRAYIPIEDGERFEVGDESLEAARWRLIGTGWFDDVRFELKKGSTRGAVVLVVHARDHNTIKISSATAGLARVVTDSSMPDDRLRPYVGVGLTESNLFGLGVGLTASTVLSAEQLGFDLRYEDRMLAGSSFSLTGRAFYNDAREFFGKNPLVASSCKKDLVPEMDAEMDAEMMPEEEVDTCDPDVAGRRAVVIYKRGGGGIGTGQQLSPTVRYTVDYLFEAVDVTNKPNAASEQRGDEIAPINFKIDDGTSFVSSVRLGLIIDGRDEPTLPNHGHIFQLYGRFASGALGSTYNFARLEASYRHWFRMPWKHVLSLGFFGGAVFGDAPFFYNFYAADLSDLLPSRVLELRLDYRRTHNLLGTSIAEMDKEELAARTDIFYRMPLYRSNRGFRALDAYLGVGLFLLTSRSDVRVRIAGYEGAAVIPVDLTFDLGVQMDTSVGLFKIGFSTLIGFLPDLGQGSQ